MNKKILVTGSMGFIGQAWSNYLLKRNFEVIGIDIKKNLINHPNFKYYEDTIFNFDLLKKLIKKSDLVCHFAGIAEPDLYLSRTNKVIDITILPLVEISNICSNLKKKLVYILLRNIWKIKSNSFCRRGDRLYGTTMKSRWVKLLLNLYQHYIYGLNQTKKLEYIIFRLFNIYGPNLKGRVIDTFISNALKNEDLIINGSGNQTRCYTYIDDCIKGFYLTIFGRQVKNETFNIGNRTPVSVNTLAKLIIKLTKSNSKIIKYDKSNKHKDMRISKKNT